MRQSIEQPDPVQNSVEITVMPGRNGGTLLRGSNFGNKGGGRTKSEVRAMCLEGFAEALPQIVAIATGKRKKVSAAEQISAFGRLGKFGLGKTTILIPESLLDVLAEALAEEPSIPLEVVRSVGDNIGAKLKVLEE